jgi:meiotically up-regulated gene 157 (Mug157) protein
MVAGLIRRQMQLVRLDPYANAFFKDTSRISEWASDQTLMLPGVHERKYELDSLCAVLRLAEGYHANTGDLSWFDKLWLDGFGLILETIAIQQEGTSFTPPYRFVRSGSEVRDSLTLGGHGQPAKRCGLSKSHFRPSDDAAQLPFLIPANAMAVVSLRRMAAIVKGLPNGALLAKRALRLADEMDAAICKTAIVSHRDCGDILAYEVDGYGSAYLMDEPNVPNLLSLPYLGYLEVTNPLYQRTREFALSEHNPYYFAGRAGRGIGGLHVGLGFIWPMAIIMQALTSVSADEVVNCLSQLKHTHGGTGFIHETFWKDDATNFTRKWFAWANTLFGELILDVDRKYPGLLEREIF